MTELLQAIAEDIKDIFAYGIETTKTYTVPSRHDNALTFPIGAEKKGKTIETCVLFIDIRNSTQMSRALKSDKVRLGKIYEAFIYAMTWVADEYGYVRNIVGDRVMVVFEPNGCFVNAVNCAALMYTVAMNILKPLSGLKDFKVGIGIEYGELLILKGGIQKRDKEQSEYKGLVWVGDAANIASKLTDCAGKRCNKNYQVTYSYDEFVWFNNPAFDPNDIRHSQPRRIFDRPEPERKLEIFKRTGIANLTAEQFVKEVFFKETGETYYSGHRVTAIIQTGYSGSAAPILMTSSVYYGYRNAAPESPFLKQITERTYPHCPANIGKIYGGVIIVPEINQLKTK